MPDKIKKGGSWFILGTYVTALALAVTYFLGGELLASHDNRIVNIHMQETIDDNKAGIDSINNQMKEFIQFSNENRIVLSTQSVEIQHCKDNIKKCEEMHK